VTVRLIATRRGFPGFLDKLWLADRDTAVYRGLYDWDGAAAAEDYATRLSRVLPLVAVRASIGHRVLLGIDRSAYLSGTRAIPSD
jgi:hypothetical protein